MNISQHRSHKKLNLGITKSKIILEHNDNREISSVIEDSADKIMIINTPDFNFPCYEMENSYFEQSDLRSKMEEIFDIDSKYTVLMTTINPQAVKALESQRREEGNPLAPMLMDSYMYAIETQMSNRHPHSYITYPLVNGMHHRDGLFWPRIHVIKDISRNEFYNILNGLNNDISYKIMENGHNRMITEVNFLKKRNILPLIVLPNEWKVDGPNLKNAVDFLTRYYCCSESRNNRDDD